jgi:EF hand
MKIKAVTIVVFTLGISITPALAQTDDWGWHMWGWGRGPGSMMGGGMMGRMGTIDTNNDGLIGDDEAAAQVEAVYATMDADEDGDLTESEYTSVRMGPGFGLDAERQKIMQERKKARFAEMDADKSGKVSKSEFIVAAKARFTQADTDKDGKVTPWEFRAMHWQ